MEKNIDWRQTPEYQTGIYSIVRCPVCGNETLDNYWICPACNWEYDPFPDEDGYSDCNGGTIAQYREAYLKQKQEATK